MREENIGVAPSSVQFDTGISKMSHLGYTENEFYFKRLGTSLMRLL